MNDKTIEEAAKVFTEIANTGTVYQDAIQPIAKQIGRSLETMGGVINVALGPVALMVQGYELIHERLKTKLEEKLRSVPKDYIIEPPLPIVGPLLEKYRFVHNDDELADLFENLLANAMDGRTVRHAHPAFVQILAQLSPDEARLLKIIAEDPFMIPKLDLDISFQDDGAGGLAPQGSLNVIANLTTLDLKAKLDDKLTRAYIENLKRLGIMCVGEEIRDSSVYEPLMHHPIVKRLEEGATTARLNLEKRKGRIGVEQNFGIMFVRCVLRKIEEIEETG